MSIFVSDFNIQADIKDDEKIICPKCKSDNIYLETTTNSRGHEVIKCSCCSCGKFIKFISHKKNSRACSSLNKWAKKVKERDTCCVICGETETLEAHHLIPAFYNKDLEYDINNGVALCKKHHSMIHDSYKKYKDR